MRRLHRLAVAAAAAALIAACAPRAPTPPSSTALGDEAITIGAFDFAESELLGELYAQALESHRYVVRRAFHLGPREFVVPALRGGLIEMVPEYAGTALRFLSLDTAAVSDLAEIRVGLERVARPGSLAVLASAGATDANAFVVSRETAEQYGLTSLSDLAAVSGRLTFGGPPECPSRALCLAGLEDVYGVHFDEVVALDAGGPLTLQALRTGIVDVALMFTTDPALGGVDLVELTDDRHLQPPENVTPLVRTEVVDRHGAALVAVVDAVSTHLTTAGLRALNGQVDSGRDVPLVAADWLRSEGLT